MQFDALQSKPTAYGLDGEPEPGDAVGLKRKFEASSRPYSSE